MSRKPPAQRCGPSGVTLRHERGAKSKLVRTTGKRWSDAAEARFLEVLAASANVSAAAEAAGFSTTAIYVRRLNQPQFAARWAQAMEVGYTRLECLALAAGTSALEGVPFAADHPMPDVTMADVLNLLKLHRVQVRGGAEQRYGWRRQEPGIEEVRAEVLRKVAVMEGVDEKICSNLQSSDCQDRQSSE